MSLKISLIILQSLDGFIAKSQADNLDWGSKVDKTFFRQKTKEIGTMIMGRKTYQNMPSKVFNEKFNLVMTSNPLKFTENFSSNIYFFGDSPQKAIDFLINKGIKEAALIGGGQINNIFLQNNLVDEIFITIAPKIFGQGITGFGKNEMDRSLELLDFQKISENELFLHYKVLK